MIDSEIERKANSFKEQNFNKIIFNNFPLSFLNSNFLFEKLKKKTLTIIIDVKRGRKLPTSKKNLDKKTNSKVKEKNERKEGKF